MRVICCRPNARNCSVWTLFDHTAAVNIVFRSAVTGCLEVHGFLNAVTRVTPKVNSAKS